jgi:hypothetical protein
MGTAPVNQDGHPATLVARHDGNTNRLVHGLYSTREHLTPRGQHVATWLAGLPHVTEADQLAAQEVGALTSILERIDAALADGRVESRRGEARALLDLRRRYSTELGRWLDRFGATPRGRAEWARQLAEGGLAAEIARRRNETP